MPEALRKVNYAKVQISLLNNQVFFKLKEKIRKRSRSLFPFFLLSLRLPGGGLRHGGHVADGHLLGSLPLRNPAIKFRLMVRMALEGFRMKLTGRLTSKSGDSGDSNLGQLGKKQKFYVLCYAVPPVANAMKVLVLRFWCYASYQPHTGLDYYWFSNSFMFQAN